MILMQQSQPQDTGGESSIVGKNVLKRAPRLGELYWCQFHPDSIKPEFWKKRPVMVASYQNNLSGPILIIPFSTDPQDGNRWAIRAGVIFQHDGRASWAVCNHLYTVSCSRLTADRGKVPKIDKTLRDKILELSRRWISDPSY